MSVLDHFVGSPVSVLADIQLYEQTLFFHEEFSKDQAALQKS